MKNTIFIILMFFSFSVQSQNLPSSLDECSKLLAKVERSMNDIKDDDINALLASTNKFCLKSVEFSEWVNELIYTIAQKKPDALILAFSNQSPEVQDNIISELISPVHDGIDVTITYRAIEQAKEHAAKHRLLSAIKSAAEKSGLKL